MPFDRTEPLPPDRQRLSQGTGRCWRPMPN